MNNSFEAVKAFKYATEEKAPIYRAIIRFLYEQHERFKNYSKTGEILSYLQKNKYVEDGYTEDNLYMDLKTLQNWECVLSREDKEKVNSIEEFKRKRLKFQITQLATEIEGILKRLDELDDGLTGSLRGRDFERINKYLAEFSKAKTDSDANEVLHEKWANIMNSLKGLRRDSTNYLAHLKSEQAEELFKTNEFLLYKEKFTDYLNKFVLSMKQNRYKISRTIKSIPDSFVNEYIDRLTEYFSSIPSIDGRKFDAERNKRLLWERWMELKYWFVRGGSEECDVEVLLRETEKSIQMLSRYALRLSEIKNSNRNRKEDYRTLASMFQKCESIEEAHELSACCFGVFHTKHIVGGEKLTDTTDSEIWEESPAPIITPPKVKNYKREQRTKSYVKVSEEEKKRKLEAIIEERNKESEVLKNLAENGKVVLSELGTIEPFVRKTLLKWITKAATSKSKKGKTEFGVSYAVSINKENLIKLRCTDGVMTLPDVELKFEEN